MGKRVIRQGCWESNSSAQHVLVKKKEGHLLTRDELVSMNSFEYDTKNMWMSSDVRDGYGRAPFTVLTSPREKIGYAICAMCGKFESDDPRFKENYDKILKAVQEVLPNVEDFELRTECRDVYLDQDGEELGRYELVYRYVDGLFRACYKDTLGSYHVAREASYQKRFPDVGGIENGSNSLLEGYLKNHDIPLKEFIFNSKYVMIVDGDELDIFGKMLKAGIINTDAIEEVVE